MQTTEADVRAIIDKLLQEAGWNNEKIKREVQVKLNNEQNGFADYVLYDEYHKPLVVIEAKGPKISPLAGKRQAIQYASALKARYIILTNGSSHIFIDNHLNSAVPIVKFPTPESLKAYVQYKPNPKALVEEKIDKAYIAKIKKLNIEEFAEYQNLKTRKNFLKRENLQLLREYQVDAIHAIQNAVSKGKQRFLLEMATGTGKTFTTAGIIRLFLKTGNAKRVLFLVDRIELEEQAHKAFTDYFGKAYTVYIYKRHKRDWQAADIVISTVQTLLSDNRFKKEFSPVDFQLVMADEAHRSIAHKARIVFEYFQGYKLGLTATPKQYLDFDPYVDAKAKDTKITLKALEARLLRDTYQIFGCKPGQPTFRYDLVKGAKDGYLVMPNVIDIRTNITTKLLSDQGYAIPIKDENGEDTMAIFKKSDFEKQFFNQQTNIAIAQAVIKQAQKDPITGEIGKTIIYAVSQNHAFKLANILNNLAQKIWTDKYNGDFAEAVVSLVPDAQEMTTNFAQNSLNGITKWLQDYKSSKTRVVVTVSMMTTGYDCPDLLNIVLARPIFSPSLFIQIKGRGTRKHTFKYEDLKTRTVLQKEKTNYHIIDFFGNYEYFEDYDYNQLEKVNLHTKRDKNTKEIEKDLEKPLDLNKLDYVASISSIKISSKGMRIDREYRKAFEEFSKELRKDKQLKQAIKNNDFDKATQILVKEKLDKPKYYMNLSKISQILKKHRLITPKELLELVLGYKKEKDILDRNALLKTEFDNFLTTIGINNLSPQEYEDLNYLFRAYITNPKIEDALEHRDFLTLHETGILELTDLERIKNLRQDLINQMCSYVKQYVNSNIFRAN